MNIIIDVTQFLEFSLTLCTFLYKKCDAEYYVYQSNNDTDDYRLVFIVSIHYYAKFLMHATIKYTKL